MSLSSWLQSRAVELGAALCTAADRIPETFLYSFCCVSAVVLRALLDLAVRGVVLAVRSAGVRLAVAPSLKPSGAWREG